MFFLLVAIGNLRQNSIFSVSEVEANPCSNMYGGRAPFSESETRCVSNFLKSIKDRLVAYITLHSYGQFILYPWSYTEELKIPQYDLYVSSQTSSI